MWTEFMKIWSITYERTRKIISPINQNFSEENARLHILMRYHEV